jgi:hypothetical protein
MVSGRVTARVTSRPAAQQPKAASHSEQASTVLVRICIRSVWSSGGRVGAAECGRSSGTGSLRPRPLTRSGYQSAHEGNWPGGGDDPGGCCRPGSPGWRSSRPTSAPWRSSAWPPTAPSTRSPPSKAAGHQHQPLGGRRDPRRRRDLPGLGCSPPPAGRGSPGHRHRSPEGRVIDICYAGSCRLRAMVAPGQAEG